MTNADLDRAYQAAEAALATKKHDYVIRREKTQEYPFGWVFFYVPRKVAETGDSSFGVPGNGPLVVTRDLETRFLPTRKPGAEVVADFLEQWKRSH